MTTPTAPPGTRPWRAVFPRGARLRLGVGFAGSVVISLVETGAVLLLLPLMALLAGEDGTTGTVGALWRLLGQPGRDAFALYLMLAALGGFVLKDAFTLWFRWWLAGYLNHLSVSLSTRIFTYLLHAPYLMHLRRGVPDMIRSTNDSVGQFFGRRVGGGMAAATEIVTIVSISAAVAITMPLEAGAAIVYFALAGLLFLRVVRPIVRRSAERGLEASRQAFEAALQGFGGIKDIQLRHTQGFFASRYRRAAASNAQAGRVSNFVGELPKYLLEILFIVGLGALIAYSILTGSQSTLFGKLAVLGAAAFRVLPSLTRFLTNLTLWRSGVPAQEMLFRELNAEAGLRLAVDRPITEDLLPLTDAIALDALTFRYPAGERDVLADVTLRVPAGSSLGLVGGSGAGKTTLVNILLGLLEPDAGTVRADGVDVFEHLDAWQNNIAMVPQDVFLTDASLRENIAFAIPPERISDERVHAAVRRAQLDAFVESLPDGLETVIGERGARLSGGQRQRVGIARALYLEPRLLVLDEATSALDNETEYGITKTIAALRGQVTVVVIAHRLSTIRDLDRVVLLADGRVADAGTFDELTARNEQFARLVRLGSLDSADRAALE